jgi:hypothetical protein
MKQLIRNILKEEKESFYKKVADFLEPPYFENLVSMAITDMSEIQKILEHKFDHPIKFNMSPAIYGMYEMVEPNVGWVEYAGNNPNLYHISSLGRKFGKILYSEEGDYWGFKEYNKEGEVTHEWDIGGGW